MLSHLKDRAADAVADARSRARDLAEIRIETTAGRSLAATAIVAAGVLVCAWLWTAYVRWDERRVYRAEIAAASERVRRAVESGNREAAEVDRLVIDIIRGTDHALTDAEHNLRQAAQDQPMDGCPRIPARCLAGGLQPASGASGAGSPGSR